METNPFSFKINYKYYRFQIKLFHRIIKNIMGVGIYIYMFLGINYFIIIIISSHMFILIYLFFFCLNKLYIFHNNSFYEKDM